MMKATLKKRHLLIVMLLAILGLAVVTAFGVYTIFVLPDSYTVLEFVLGFAATFVFLCGGVAFIGYEGRGTPLNMVINGLFYVFLIVAVVSFIRFLIKAFRKPKSEPGKKAP
jgi:hypothetical protein